MVVVYIADVGEIIGLPQGITNLFIDGHGCLIRFQRLLEFALDDVYIADVAEISGLSQGITNLFIDGQG